MEDGGEVLRVLCLLQAAFVLLGGIGEMVLMGGSGAYLGVPLLKAVLLGVVGAWVAAGRRWALRTLIVVQAVTLAAFAIQLLAGLLLPQIDATVNLVGLLTNVALPAGMIWLARGSLVAARREDPVATAVIS